MRNERICGILLHPTSLPGPGGIGTLGDNARRFVDLLAGMGMSWWQVLPLNPPSCGNSPYSAYSAFAGNPLLVDLDTLVQEGDLSKHDLGLPSDDERVDYGAILPARDRLFHKAAAAFFASGRTPRMEDFWQFCDTTPWLHTYALFMALKQHHKGKSWIHWPKAAALLDPALYEKASVDLGPEIGVQKYLQWQFARQWSHLRAYAAAQGISIIGDIPIFVAYDSADVWSNRDIFLLDAQGKPTAVAGVPPDYFSSTGQLWGNPLYNWDELEKRGYDWWVERFRYLFTQFDSIRVDHFRGFDSAWHVPYGSRTAVRGNWVPGPGRRLFDALKSSLGQLPIIAEDLGVITPAVEALRDSSGFPGMKILQFAFDSGPGNPFLPHNHTKRCVVYTGTHDNDTTVGWYGALTEHQRCQVQEYLGSTCLHPADDLMRAALMSVADSVVIPFQDILGLPSSARMNTPGTAQGNWEWRFTWDMLDKPLLERCRRKLEVYGRRRQHL